MRVSCQQGAYERAWHRVLGELPDTVHAWQCDLETASPDSYDLDAFCQSNGFIGWCGVFSLPPLPNC